MIRRGTAILVILSLAFIARGQNVGVGVALPNDLFHVYGSTATMGILFNNVTTGNSVSDGLRITIDGSSNVLLNQQEAASMQFWTGSGVSNALRMTIDASGNVGINAVPVANEQLLVSGTSVNSAGIVGVGNGGASGFPAGATGIGVMGVVGNGNPNVGVAGYHGAAVNVGAKGAGIFGTSDIATGYGIYGFNSAANGTAGYFSATGASGNALIIPGGGGSVGIGTVAPDVSSILDMSGISAKGMLIPKVALSATNAAGSVPSPATSLLVYNTATSGAVPFNVTPGYYYNAGTSVVPNWVQLVVSGGAISTGWLTMGNSGTAPGTFAAPGVNFLGTIDNFDFAVRTNNTERMRFASNGIIGINLAPIANYQLSVANTAISGTGNTAIYGATTSIPILGTNGGAGVVGVGNGGAFPATFNGNAGVVGAVGSSASSAGVIGYSGAPANYSKPKVSGVYGESTFQGNPGVVGLNTANAGSGTTASGGYGVFGSTAQSQSSGVFGNNSFGGAGVTGKSISNSSSIFGNGVQGISDGNGVYGVTSAFGASASNYAGVYGQYLPNSAATAQSGMAAIVGFNDNFGSPGTFNGNIGVEGLYNVGGPSTYYGIGILGLGYGVPGPPPPMINSDFGVVGVIGSARTSAAAVAGYFGTYTATTYPVPAANAAIFGNSNSAGNWALYGNNSAAAGKGLLVNGFSNLIGQVAVNQVTVPNAALQMVTAGSTYSDNQVYSIPLFTNAVNTWNLNFTALTDLGGIEAPLEPNVSRSDGNIDVKMVVYYTNNALTSNFQLRAYQNNGGTSATPITTASGWTFYQVNGTLWVATSNWVNWVAGTNGWELIMNASVNSGGSDNIRNVDLLVRPHNN